MIDEIKKRDESADELAGRFGELPPAHADRRHLLKMVDALAEVVAEWSAFVDDEGEGRDVGHYIRWADAQAGGEG
jgi:hypothetical protein